MTKYFRPLRILQFYFNAQQKGNSPIQFNEEVATIDFQEESTKYTALITAIWDGDGLHLSLRTESQRGAAAELLGDDQ